MKILFNFASDSKVILKASGQTETIDLWARAHKLFEGHASRVNVVDSPVSNPSSGKTAARPDGRTTLNLPNEVGTPARAQKRDHPSGIHYWLPLDANNRFICEPGQRHRKWYLSKSPAAMTKAQIAANAGVAESAVTAAWLLTRFPFGRSPQTAIHADLQPMLRGAFTAADYPSRSDHWFMECDYDYTDLNWSGFSGEDELHPLLISAWGTGAKPVIQLASNALALAYAVIDGAATTRKTFKTWYGYANIFSHMSFGQSVDGQRVQSLTYYENDILRAWMDSPHPISGITADGKWHPQGGNHIQGIFTADTEELAIIDNQIDHSGWADGYDYHGDPTKPQPPSMYSHCLYLSATTYDATVRGNLLSRAAAQGIGKVGGIQLEANLFVDNNYQIQLQAPVLGQCNNVMDNVAFSAGYKRVGYAEGGFNMGMTVNGLLASMAGNLIAHRANPDDETDIANKVATSANGGGNLWEYGVKDSAGKLIDDTQSWKWSDKIPARNVEGIDPMVLDQTTIQRFTGMKMGKPLASIVEMVEYVAARPSKGAFVDEAIRWSKARFGTPIPERTTPADLIFYPDSNFDGFRWDNRRNWSTKDLPGTHMADSVNLAGNFVRFGLTNANIAALKSRGGLLDVTSGKLEIGALTDATDLTIRKAGQVWIGDADHPLSIEAISGRLALTGAAADLDLHAGGQAQILLGPDCTVPASKSLVVSGQRARVGWDGTGTATLTISGKLKFRRGVCLQFISGGMNNIRYAYKHSGQEVTGSTSGFKGRIGAVERTSSKGDNFNIWLYDVTGTPVVGDVFEISPGLNKDRTHTAKFVTVTSVVDQGIVPLQRFRSGGIGDGLTDPTVSATITFTSTAQIVVPQGLPQGQSYDLTGPSVAVVNNGATLPVGVSITGGKLVFMA